MAIFLGSLAMNKASNMLNNAFSFLKRKKEEPYQASGYGSQYANNLSNYSTEQTPYQASGMTSQYAINPTNYQAPQQNFNTSNYLDKIKQNSQNRINLTNQATEGLVGNLRKSGEAGVNALKSQIPALQGGFDKFKQGVYAGLGNVQSAADMAKEQAKNTYGSALRQGAEGWRQTQGQIDKKFANLNAVDSSAYQNKYVNAGQEFANQQQGILGQQAQELTRLDNEVVQARIDAEQLISQEETNLQLNIAQINASIAQGTAEYEQAISDAYNNAQMNIYDIQDQLAQFENDVALETQKLQTENLTSSNATSDILGVANQLFNSNTDAITGMQMPFAKYLPGSSLTVNLYDQLKGLLSLENRQKLKGSGAISDYESRVLEQAASALGRNLSNEDFKQVLGQLINNLSQGQQYSSQDQTIRVRNLQTGETGTIPINEFDSRLYERI